MVKFSSMPLAAHYRRNRGKIPSRAIERLATICMYKGKAQLQARKP